MRSATVRSVNHACAAGEEAPFLDDVLSQCRTARQPPLLPNDFRMGLEAKTFHNERSPRFSACAHSDALVYIDMLSGLYESP